MLKYSFWIWIGITVGLSIALSLAFPLSKGMNASAAVFLPGKTSHGHHQIELKCSACHDAMMGVREDACLQCHQAALKASRDTHPKSKFDDPAMAKHLSKIDARSCLTCHKEHVPEQTHAMGVTMPADYCSFCHSDIGEHRISHKGFSFQSCSTSGCHNYHDNTSLYEKFLTDHADEPSVKENPRLPVRKSTVSAKSLILGQQDVPLNMVVEGSILDDWAQTAHAKAGVNCQACHTLKSKSESLWSDRVGMEACQACHEKNVDGFLNGMHGMRLAVGLSAMTPAQSTLMMSPHSLHAELNCMACHDDHRFDTQFAAVEACLKCHDDTHSRAYVGSSHEQLWREELVGKAEAGSGVTCASCHMPREVDRKGNVAVVHNQNETLRPNEKMIRTVCINCHGLQFSLDSLADPQLVDLCYSQTPDIHVQSLTMAVERMNSRLKSRTNAKK
jgi:hypothetical protein